MMRDFYLDHHTHIKYKLFVEESMSTQTHNNIPDFSSVSLLFSRVIFSSFYKNKTHTHTHKQRVRISGLSDNYHSRSMNLPSITQPAVITRAEITYPLSVCTSTS